MHILHVAPYYRPAYAFGGVVRAVEGLARAQAAHSVRVSVLTTDALTPTIRYKDMLHTDEDSVQVTRIRNLLYVLRRFNLSSPLGMRRAAAALFDTESVDIVHLHELRTLEAQWVTPEAAQRNIPVVLSPHGTLTTSTGRGALKRLWDRFLTPHVVRHLAAVVGLNDDETAEARSLVRVLGGENASMRFATIPNGVDVDAFTRLDGRAAFRAAWGLGDAPVILFLGRLHARKGVDVLARAFAQVEGDARLLVVGPDEGMMPVLRALAAEDPRIVLTGFLDGAARLGALAAADVFALPATGEGLSMAMLEAMAAGLPLVLSPGCHLPEAEAVGAALIVSPEDALLSGALRLVLGDPALRRRMGAAAQTLARDRFSWSSVVAAWNALYGELLGERGVSIAG